MGDVAYQQSSEFVARNYEADPDKRREYVALLGEVPSLAHRPSGCEFHTRCPRAQDLCRQQTPNVFSLTPAHTHRCYFPAVLE